MFSKISSVEILSKYRLIQGHGTNGFEHIQALLAQWILDKNKIGIFKS